MFKSVRFQNPKKTLGELSMQELVTVVNSRYNDLLRRKAAPPIFCYVCSRVDPSGVFRNRNSYFFRHGFFNKCEHMLQGPHPTFVRTAVVNQDEKDDDDAYETKTINGPTKTSHITSIKVTIGMRPDIDVKYLHDYVRSPTKTSHFIENPQDDKTEQSVDETNVFLLPPVFGTRSSSRVPVQNTKDGRLFPVVRKETFSEVDDNSHKLQSQIHHEQMPTRTMNVEILAAEEAEEDVVEIAPLLSDQISLRYSRIEQEGKVKQLKAEYPSPSSYSLGLGSFSTQKRRSLVKMDGISVSNEIPVYTIGAHLQNSVPGTFNGDLYSCSLPTRHSRPLGARSRSGMTKCDAHDDDMHSDICTGIIRYHHRTTEDSVPDTGFAIPKTLKPLTEFGKKDFEIFENEIALATRGFKPSTKDTASESIISLPDSNSFIIQRISGQFCECSPDERKIAIKTGICLSCGKKLRKGITISFHTDDSDTTSSVQRSTHGVRRSVSRQKTNEHSHLSRMTTYEDYLDIGKIIQEDKANYWNSEADEDIFDYIDGDDNALSPIKRFREARPFPTVDPEIHKKAYLKALQDVRGKKIVRIQKFEDFENGFKLRQPHVFSYFTLWSTPSKKRDKWGHDIGLRADRGNIPKSIKNEKLMKHIFGDVKVDDYYPGGKGNPPKNRKNNDVINDTLLKPKKASS